MSLHTSACPLDCPDACGVLVETDPEGRLVRLRGNPDHPWSAGSLCGKTAIYHELVHSPERLGEPLVREHGELRPATWDEALDRVAAGLDGLRGEELLDLHYAGNMGLVQRGFPERLTNALSATGTDGAICDSTSDLGYQLVLGHPVGPDLKRVVEADALVLWGCDAVRTVQHLMPRIKELCDRGVPVRVIDIYRSDTVRRVEAWGGQGIIVRPGSDSALALGLAELAFQRGHADLGSLGRDCTGAAEFRAEIAGQYPPERVTEATGLSWDEISALSDLMGGAERLWIKTGIGWNRRRNGGMGMRAVTSLAAVLGAADRLHFESSAHFGLDSSCITRPDLRRPDAPEPIHHVELGAELETGRFRAALVWGHNPAVTVPDSLRVRRGFQRDDLFLVVHELFLTETARLADVVLPATALPEHSDVFKSYGHRVFQVSRQVCEAPAQQRSNVDTFKAIAGRLGLEPELFDVTDDELIETFLEANRARFTADELTRVRAGEPVELGDRDLPDRGTPSGRIELVSETAEAHGQPRIASHVPDDAGGDTGRFWLVSAPSIATHNSTYLQVSRHAARAGEPRCFLHPSAALSLSLSEGDRVRISNGRGALTLELALDGGLPEDVVRFDGFPDPSRVPEGMSSNALTSPLPADLAHGNSQFSVRVDVGPIAG